MEKIFKQTKEKIEGFIFGRKSVNELLEKEYKADLSFNKKIFLPSIFFLLLSIVGLLNIDISNVEVIKDEVMASLIAILMLILFCSLIFSLLSAFFYYKFMFFNKVKYFEYFEEVVKIREIKRKDLSLKELEELKPLFHEIKEKLSEMEFVALMKIAEIKSGEILGNAYYFYYIINNYEDLIVEVKQHNENKDFFKKKLFSLFDHKENQS